MTAQRQKAYKERHPDRVKESLKRWRGKNVLKRRLDGRLRKTKLNQNKRYYDATKEAANSREKWTLKEEMAIFSDMTDRELSVLLGRSMRAIQVKRAKLKSSGCAPCDFASKGTAVIETPNA